MTEDQAADNLMGNKAGAKRPASTIVHTLKWIVAIAGVFFAVCAIQVAVSVYGSIWLVRLNRFGADGSTGDVDLLAIGVAAQLVWLVVAILWWRHVRRRGMGVDPATVREPVAVCYGRVRDAKTDLAGSEPESNASFPAANSTLEIPLSDMQGRDHPRHSPAHAVKTLLAIVLMGIGLQIVISLLITLTLPLFPEIEREYTELMESAGIDAFTPLSILSVAVLAPVVEELTFRGVAFQFALRSVTPGWNKRLAPGAYAGLPISRVRFWVANALQALAFGIMHLNITQGLYAFAIGLVLGWLFGRTGQLRYSIALHLAINFSSYFVDEILDAFSLFGGFGPVVLSIACAVGGIWLFARSVPALPWSVEAR